jgi:CDP-paratose 2-epimerase
MSSKVAIVTGAGGLIGSQAVRYFSDSFDAVIGIDNDSRAYFFGDEASTRPSTERLIRDLPSFRHHAVDIRDWESVRRIFVEHSGDIRLVIHAAAQPSHDWAAREPFTDFTINANGTLNLLEATRLHAPEAVFVFTSTNKVYGDTPNQLPLVEQESRWEVAETHPYYAHGIDESMSIDQSKHSLFGASKVAADVLVQEYGRYFGLKTGVFRGGCLTGPNHAGTELHGFLSYLMKCAIQKREYTIFGYKGKQVRDNIHSHDLIRMFDCFYRKPRCGEVYNAGGSRKSNCSMKEAIRICEEITSNRMQVTYSDTNRIGDHIWYVSDVGKFRRHYPDWEIRHDIPRILGQIYEHEMRLAAS